MPWGLEKIFERRKEKTSEVMYRLKSGKHAGVIVVGEPYALSLLDGQRNLYCFKFVYKGRADNHGYLIAKELSDLFEVVSV